MAKIEKTTAEWRQLLTEEQYRITRLTETEPAFSGDYVSNQDTGTYQCVCCGTALFHSQHKFDSGCGWPSFHSQIEHGVVNHQADYRFGLDRTEVRCETCDAHLGHLFDDGPKPTGLRYCINSVALQLHAED